MKFPKSLVHVEQIKRSHKEPLDAFLRNVHLWRCFTDSDVNLIEHFHQLCPVTTNRRLLRISRFHERILPSLFTSLSFHDNDFPCILRQRRNSSSHTAAKSTVTKYVPEVIINLMSLEPVPIGETTEWRRAAVPRHFVRSLALRNMRKDVSSMKKASNARGYKEKVQPRGIAGAYRAKGLRRGFDRL
jgi:hypothetical protein